MNQVNKHYPNGLNDILIKKALYALGKVILREKLVFAGEGRKNFFGSSKSDHKFENLGKLGPLSPTTVIFSDFLDFGSAKSDYRPKICGRS